MRPVTPWLLRIAIGGALLGVLGLIVVPQLRSNDGRSEASSRPVSVRATEPGDASSPVVEKNSEPVAEPPSSQNDSGRLPDDVASTSQGRDYESPILGGIDGLLDAQAEILGEEPEGLRGALGEADATLTRIKRSNAVALRDLSRQVRVAGPSSPNLIIALEHGVSSEDVDLLTATPGGSRVFATGRRFTSFYSGGGTDLRNVTANLLEGKPSSAVSGSAGAVVGERNLVEALWQSGYRTAVVGDLSPFYREANGELQPSRNRIDFAMGYLPEQTGSSFWLNGTRVDPSGSASRLERMIDEATYFIGEAPSRRPFVLLLSFPSRAVTEKERSPAATAVLLERLQPAAERVGTTATFFVRVPASALAGTSATERERALQGTLQLHWPAQSSSLMADDRLLSSAQFPSLVCRLVGVHPAPKWAVSIPPAERAQGSEASPRALGWRFSDGTLYRYRDSLVWHAHSGTRSTWTKQTEGWSEDPSEVSRIRLEEFDRFLADKSGE